MWGSLCFWTHWKHVWLWVKTQHSQLARFDSKSTQFYNFWSEYVYVCVYVLYFFFIIIPLFHRRAHHGFRQLFNFYSCNSSNKQEFSLIVSQQLRRFYFYFLFALDEKIFSYHIKKYNILFLNNFCCRRLRTLWIYYVSYLYIYFHFFSIYLFVCSV